MTIGVIGRKSGMTRVFTDDGASIPVTVVTVGPNRVSQIKTPEQDGYYAIQVTAGSQKASRVTKPMAGHFAKAGIEAGRLVKEFRDGSANEFNLGDVIDLSRFAEGQEVDVRANSRGKGFAGAIKRHNFSGQRNTHGNSRAHRAPGSIGQNQTPGKVFKGKKMAGQLGNKPCTVQNLTIVQIDQERGLLLIKGGVPGAPGADVIITPAVKAKSQEKVK